MMSTEKSRNDLPYLLNRAQASYFLGMDPVSFDKYVKSNNNLDRFMVGNRERYTIEALREFIKTNSI